MLDLQDYANAWDHLIAWAVYLVAAAIICFALWRLTKRWLHEIRYLLLALIAVALFVPAPVPGHAVLAPAVMFVLFGMLSGGEADVLAPVLVRLSLAGTVAVLLVVISSIVWRWSRRKAR
jgi:chromate transport protein ChrA